MAIDPLSNALYHDIAKKAMKPDNKAMQTNVKSEAAGAMNIGVKELPAAVRTQGSSQYDSERDKKKENSYSAQQLQDAIKKANGQFKTRNTRCEFAYHEKINRVSIKILDRDTEEVIREIPPEEAIEMVEKMWELAGFLVDEKR